MTRLKDGTFESGSATGTNGLDAVSGTPTMVTGANALKGSYSVSANAANTYVREDLSPAENTIYVSCYFKALAVPSVTARFLTLVNSAGSNTSMPNIAYGTDGTIRARFGSTNIASANISLNTLYRIVLRYTVGTGSNAIITATLYTGDSTLGNSFASKTDSTLTDTTARIYVGSVTSDPVNMVFDDIRIDNASAPGPSTSNTTYTKTFIAISISAPKNTRRINTRKVRTFTSILQRTKRVTKRLRAITTLISKRTRSIQKKLLRTQSTALRLKRYATRTFKRVVTISRIYKRLITRKYIKTNSVKPSVRKVAIKKLRILSVCAKLLRKIPYKKFLRSLNTVRRIQRTSKKYHVKQVTNNIRIKRFLYLRRIRTLLLRKAVQKNITHSYRKILNRTIKVTRLIKKNIKRGTPVFKRSTKVVTKKYSITASFQKRIKRSTTKLLRKIVTMQPRTIKKVLSKKKKIASVQVRSSKGIRKYQRRTYTTVRKVTKFIRIRRIRSVTTILSFIKKYIHTMYLKVTSTSVKRIQRTLIINRKKLVTRVTTVKRFVRKILKNIQSSIVRSRRILVLAKKNTLFIQKRIKKIVRLYRKKNISKVLFYKRFVRKGYKTNTQSAIRTQKRIRKTLRRVLTLKVSLLRLRRMYIHITTIVTPLLLRTIRRTLKRTLVHTHALQKKVRRTFSTPVVAIVRVIKESGKSLYIRVQTHAVPRIRRSIQKRIRTIVTVLPAYHRMYKKLFHIYIQPFIKRSTRIFKRLRKNITLRVYIQRAKRYTYYFRRTISTTKKVQRTLKIQRVRRISLVVRYKRLVRKTLLYTTATLVKVRRMIQRVFHTFVQPHVAVQIYIWRAIQEVLERITAVFERLDGIEGILTRDPSITATIEKENDIV